jgi:hypothetical protein
VKFETVRSRPGRHPHRRQLPWAPHWTAPPLPADGRATTKAWFYTPGEYVLRVRADDGALTTDQQVVVVVK